MSDIHLSCDTWKAGEAPVGQGTRDSKPGSLRDDQKILYNVGKTNIV